MAMKVNELKQQVIEGKRTLNEALDDQQVAKATLAALLRADSPPAGALTSARGAAASADAAVSRNRGAVQAAEEALHAEEQRLADETARAVPAGSALPVDAPWYMSRRPADPEDATSLRGLPALSSRTRSAIARACGASRAGAVDTRENLRAVVAAALGATGPMHPSIMAAIGTEGVDAEGGFAVVADTAAGIFTRAAEESVWLRIGVRVEPMTTAEREVLALDDADESSDAESGLTAQQLPEATTATVQALKVRRVHLHADKLAVLAAVSNELGEDAPDFVAALEAALSRAIAKKFDRIVLTGAGVNPGILNGPALLSVAKEGGQNADTIVIDNVVKMWSRLASGSHEAAWWLTHPSCLPQLLKMALVVGTGGGFPRWGFETGGPTGYNLFGRPVVVTSRVKKLGDLGDLILVDPSQVVVGLRRGITVQRSEHALFSQDSLAIRATMRACAGQLWNATRTLVEGTDTVSAYVALAERA